MYNPNPPPPRAPGPNDYAVDVEGLGRFIFANRQMGDQFAIEIEMARLTQGVHPNAWLAMMGEWLATLRVLMVAAPPEFSLDDLDPLDDDDYTRISSVFKALREKEDSFRQAKKAKKQGLRQGAGRDSSVLVSTQVQPLPAGSTVPGTDAR